MTVVEVWQCPRCSKQYKSPLPLTGAWCRCIRSRETAMKKVELNHADQEEA